MTNKKLKTEVMKHRILREVYRHYIDFEDFYKRTGQHVIEHNGISISFLDLKYDLNKLSKRKKEAFFYNVILDQKQEDVAKIMGITTVTVGQYVEAACIILSKRHFSDVEESIKSTKKKDTSDTK